MSEGTVTKGLEKGLKTMGVKGEAIRNETSEDVKQQLAKLNDPFAVIGDVNKTGLPMPQKPEMNIEDDWNRIKSQHGGLSNVPSPLLGEYLDKFNAALGYAYYCLAIADYESISAKTQKEFAKERLFLIQPTMSNKDTQYALVHADPLYLELSEKHTHEYGKWRVLDALVKNYEKKAEAISREITRRGGEASFTARAHNANNF